MTTRAAGQAPAVAQRGTNAIALPPLPLDAWQPTLTALHLFCQVIGKVRLELMPKRNHWWHVPLYVSSRGVTTRPIPLPDGSALELELEIRAHRLRITRTPGEEVAFSVRDLVVADFHRLVMSGLNRLGVEVEILARPFDLPFDTPFDQDRDHRYTDLAAVDRWWRILLWGSGVLEEFSGRFNGKQSPVHLFWHSFDLALTRFSGRTAPPRPDADPVTQEAYSHEVISFGFWAGDNRISEPTWYAYAAPEPEGLAEADLAGPGARWHDTGGGHLALLTHDRLRQESDPRTTLLRFLESAYRAGAARAEWPLEELTAEWSSDS